MTNELQIMKSQSVVLVDIFAAAFLFIFVAFLSLYTMFLLSIDTIENRSTGGWKMVSGTPFDSRIMNEGLELHATGWQDEAFIELRSDRIVTHARTYSAPRAFDMKNGADPTGHLKDFFRTVHRNHERLGNTPMAEAGYGDRPTNRPSVNLFVFDSRHYYHVRDLVQEAKVNWSEFSVPQPASENSDQDDDQLTIANDTVDSGSYSQNWQNLISSLHNTRAHSETNMTEPVITPLTLVELDELEITIRMISTESRVEYITDRLIPLLFALIIAIILAEAIPHYKHLRAQRRLRKMLAGELS